MSAERTDTKDAINMEAVAAGLKAVRGIRSTVGELIRTFTEGLPPCSDEEEQKKAFCASIQTTLTNLCARARELETACTLIGSPSANAPANALNLGNIGLLSQDPAYDKSPLYLDLIKAYQWCDRVHELSSHAAAILNQNSLKRSNINPGLTLKRLRRGTHNGHNVSSPSVDSFAAGLDRLFPDMSVKVLRPFGAPTILKVTLARTFKALVLLRGLIIEWVVIRGYTEDLYNDDEQLDLWSSSRYKVFQKVTDHANAAMLHFYSPLLPELGVRSFITWLHSYVSLFSAPCRRCGSRLQLNMPPTWRDVRHLDVYHEVCRP